ncbi:MAG: helix-turn-helix transcriptional regulator [Dysgonomonas sp.]|nr:helix-turn-helix transcriptional regulator [Dysgonomonas sp.]
MSEIQDTPQKIDHGKVLRVLRVGKKLTQKQLAHHVNMSQSKICNLECEKIIPKEDLEVLAQYFKVSVEFFDMFNFEDAANYLNYHDNENTITTSDSSKVEEVNTANEIEKVITNNYYESEKVQELFNLRIEDAKTIGRLEEKVSFLEKEIEKLRNNK